jgi:hypothetical protein
MFTRLAGLISGWWPGISAVLLFCVLAQAAACDQRGREIDLLRLEVKTLTDENNSLVDEAARLKKSALVVSAAAQAQGIVCQVELVRRAAIDEIAEARPASKPEEAVDDQASRKAVHLLNSDLFAPLGLGLRRAADRPGSGGSAVPGSNSSGHAGFERE